MRLRHGYSHVELIIAILVIGIVAAVSMPRFAASIQRQRAEAAARRVAADLEALRGLASTTSQQQSAVFDISTNSYTLAGLTNPDRPGQPYKVSLASQLYGSILVSANFGGDATILFNGYGVPDSSGTVMLKSGQTTKTITIEPNLGLITIQ